MLALRQGHYAAARAYLDEALTFARRRGDPKLLVSVLASVGFVARVQDDYPAARSALEEGLKLAPEAGDDLNTATILHHLGLLDLEADGDLDSAWTLNDQSLALYRQIGNRRMTGTVLGNMGRVARASGDLGAARALLAESVITIRDIGDLGLLPQMLYSLAAVDADGGQFEQAVTLQAAAAKLEETVGTQVWPANRRERDGWLGLAQAALGEQGFAGAWAQGRAMTVEQTIDAAIGEEADAEAATGS